MPRMRIACRRMAPLIAPRPRAPSAHSAQPTGSSLAVMAPIPGRHHGQRDAGRYGSAPCRAASPQSRQRRAVIIGGSMSGLFSRRLPAPDRLGRRRLRALAASNWSAAAPASPAIRNCSTRWKRAAPAPRISASRCPSASPSTATAASPTSGRCGRSSPPGTGCNSCCAPPSTRRITTSAGISSASSRTSAACACSSPAGGVEHADILVGGDGIRSSVRGQMAPEVQPIYAGYYIWRGAPNEADLAPETLSSIYPLFTFYLPPAAGGDHLSDRRLRQRPHAPASAASISSGTASPTPRSCAR